MSEPPGPAATILHVDMDAFYASVEERERPELRGRPVIVGGDAERRGVVSAANYAARRYGVHSAMPMATARRLCPHAVYLHPRIGYYAEIAEQIRAIFDRYTPLVEPLSVDEAFLDVTDNLLGEPSATRLAQAIRAEIRATTGLTASAGVSCNKFLAKVASGRQKPDGLTVIPPGQAAAFIKALPIGKFYGVGRVTEEKMHSHGIRTGQGLLRFSEAELVALFGKAGRFFFEIARGHGTRPVEPVRVRKSVGAETTLAEDIVDPDQVRAVLAELVAKLDRHLSAHKTGGRTLSLKVRYSDFTTITRSCTTSSGFFTPRDILAHLPRLLADTEAGRRPVRLLGVSVANLCDEAESARLRLRQLPLPFPPRADTREPYRFDR